ncbi:hypothetical protein ACUXV3_07110 [Roseobacteraceae bacterium NS-SX3]
MKVGIVIAAIALAGVTACEELEAPVERTEATAPEYYPCKKVPEALAQADAFVRSPGSISSNEEAYWRDRQDRLIKRAWECKKG